MRKTYDAHIHAIGSDTSVIIVRTDHGRERWEIETAHLPDDAQRGDIIEVTLGLNIEIVGDEWTQEEIDAAEARAGEMERRLFGGDDE